MVRERDGTEIPASPAIIEQADAFDASARTSLRGLLDAIDDPTAINEAMAVLQAEIDRLARRRGGRQDRGPDVRRALVIDSVMPAEQRDAGSNAILSHMRALTRQGYRVSFVAADPSQAPPPLPEIEWLGAPGIRSVEEVLVREAGLFDLVYLHRFDTAVRYMPLVRYHQPRAKLVYGLADLHHLRIARRGVVEHEPSLIARARTMRATELAAARAADAVITHSRAEATILDKAGISKIVVAPWTVPRPARPVRGDTETIGFVGHFGHAPNIDAARRLMSDLVPQLRARRPGLACLVAGSAMPHFMKRWKVDGVELCGQVDDLAAFLSRLRLTIAPMAYGAGIKGKVLDSLAAGIPCIATPVAIEGLEWPSALDACVARDDEGLVGAVIRLLDDPILYRKVVRAGRAMVARCWSDKAVDAAFATLD